MEDDRCFESGCMLNADYACPCSSPPVYTCKLHVLNHIDVHNKDHAIFIELSEETREAILKFLEKCALKHKMIKEKASASFIQRFTDAQSELEELIKEIDSNSDELNNYFRKISEAKNIIKSEQDPVLEQLSLQLDEAVESKKPEFLKSSKNPELESELKAPSSAYNNDSSIPGASVTQAYQGIVSTYQQKTSLFNIIEKDRRTNLLIYNTEIESQALIILDTPELIFSGTCIAQLPNGKLFCFGNNIYSGIAFLIDENYRVQKLPKGAACCHSSAIYFNNNIYCFGGWCHWTNGNLLTLSSRFDLNRNQWIELTPLLKADWLCNSIIFNGSILISGYNNKNLWRYSIDSNSFSTIPYDFAGFKRKMLINAERVYLIECESGSIYESEIGSDTEWRRILNSSTFDKGPVQTYCHYNKEEIYIGCIYGNIYKVFKFKLNEKRLIELAKI